MSLRPDDTYGIFPGVCSFRPLTGFMSLRLSMKKLLVVGLVGFRPLTGFMSLRLYVSEHRSLLVCFATLRGKLH